jgi:hypothetical protein
MPTDSKRATKFCFPARRERPREFPQYYVPYAQVAQATLSHAKPLQAPRKNIRMPQPSSTTGCRRIPHHNAASRRLPLRARKQSLSMLIERNSGAVLDGRPVVNRPIGAIVSNRRGPRQKCHTMTNPAKSVGKGETAVATRNFCSQIIPCKGLRKAGTEAAQFIPRAVDRLTRKRSRKRARLARLAALGANRHTTEEPS